MIIYLNPFSYLLLDLERLLHSAGGGLLGGGGGLGGILLLAGRSLLGRRLLGRSGLACKQPSESSSGLSTAKGGISRYTISNSRLPRLF